MENAVGSMDADAARQLPPQGVEMPSSEEEQTPTTEGDVRLPSEETRVPPPSQDDNVSLASRETERPFQDWFEICLEEEREEGEQLERVARDTAD